MKTPLNKKSTLEIIIN